MPTTGTWEYFTVSGQRVTVERYEPGPNGRKKGFSHKPEGVKGPFMAYRQESIRQGAVYVTESEKDCDRLLNLGYNATTFRGGAENWTHTDWSWAWGRDIVLCCDRDTPGQKMREQFSEHLILLGAASVRVVRLPVGELDGFNVCDLPDGEIDAALEKTDAAVIDWLPDVRSPDLESAWAPVWTPIPGMIRMESVALWHGAPGSGKSLLALNAIASLLTHDGERLLGRKVLEKPVPGHDRETERVDHTCLYLSLEDTENDVNGRIRALTSHYQLDPGIWDRMKSVFHLSHEPETKWKQVKWAIGKTRPTVIFIDNLRRFDAEAESDAASAQPVIEGAERAAKEIGAAMVFIHHDRKLPPQGNGKTSGDEMASGSGALIGAARLALQISKDSDETVWLNGGKSNHGRGAGMASYELLEANVCGYGVVVASPRPDDAGDGAFDGLDETDRKRMVRDILDLEPAARLANDTSQGWAGFQVGTSIGMDPVDDLGMGTRWAKQRNAEQNANRKRVTAILDAMLRKGVLAISKVTLKHNRSNRETNVYIQGSSGVSDA